MTSFNNPWRRSGGMALMLGAICAIGWLIWHYGDRIGLDSRAQKITVGLLVVLVAVLIRLAPQLIGFFRQKRHQQKGREDKVYPEQQNRLAQTPPRHVTITELQQALRQTYGRFWPRKVRILLLTGSAADVELLAPGLTGQNWQEDAGTVLLWGGDLGAQADAAWLGALRKLRRRPLDGVVWVTSALAKTALPGQKDARPALSTDMMDSVAQAFSSRYELLSWRLPLYVWSLHITEGTKADRITQSVGCLLPAGCRWVHSSAVWCRC